MTTIYNLDYIMQHLLAAVYDEDEDFTEIHFTNSMDVLQLPGDHTDVFMAASKKSDVNFVYESDIDEEAEDEEEDDEADEDILKDGKPNKPLSDLIKINGDDDIYDILTKYFDLLRK